jgi:flagellin-specific chaperone FliS
MPPAVVKDVAPSLRADPSAEQSVEAFLSDASIPDRYDQLLNHLASAEHELEAGGPARQSRHLEEASGIVFDLLYALDFRHGGELVPRLAALYGYIGNQLLNIGRSRDRVQLAYFRDIIATLRPLYYGGEGAS